MNMIVIESHIHSIAEWIWKTSLEATLLIGAIFVLSWMVGWRMSPRWRYTLGLLILARLVLPIHLPGVWGMHQLLPTIGAEPVVPRVEHDLPQATAEGAANTLSVEPSARQEVYKVGSQAGHTNTWSWTGIWAGGALLISGFALSRMVLFWRRIRNAPPMVREDALNLLAECRSCLNVSGHIEIIELPHLDTPGLFGLFRPRLLLPHGFLDKFHPQEVRMVFLHELAHLKSHDILLNWVIVLAAAVHWFNPFVWIALRNLRQDREILRDSQVLRHLQSQERTIYGETLLKLSEVFTSRAPCAGSLSVVNHRSQITRRIIMITRFRNETIASKVAGVAVVTVLALATFSTPGSEYGGETTSVPLTRHEWPESAEYVRVGKELLERIPIRPVTITDYDTMQFVLSREFVHACLLTQWEHEQMNAALNSALHEYRTIRGRHFEPMQTADEFEAARKELPYASGTYRFSLKPFEAEAIRIREALKSDVVTILGTQRASLFWQQGEMYLNGEMKTTNHAQFAGRVHHFRLLTTNSGPLVDITVKHSGGAQGRPYGKSLDAYAPEQLKPILGRWREWIAGQPEGSFAWHASTDQQRAMNIPPGLHSGKWNDSVNYVDLPTAVVQAWDVPGLTYDEQVSPEAVALLCLTESDVAAVNQLYQNMKLRVDALERSHLVKLDDESDPKRMRLIVRAFPEEAATLKREWIAELAVIIGSKRAELLDHFLQTPINALWMQDIMMGRRPGIERPTMDLESGPRWFECGQYDLRIDVRMVTDLHGVEAFSVNYESDRPESWGNKGPRLIIPARLRHLLTPQLLDKAGPV